MKFKEFLNELLDIEVGEAADSENAVERSAVDSEVFESVNLRLFRELNDFVLSPEQGVQKIRKVLHNFNLDMPALYDSDPLGDESVIELKRMDENSDDVDAYLYYIYYLNDNGLYEFHAEIAKEEDLDNLLSDEEDEELEEL